MLVDVPDNQFAAEGLESIYVASTLSLRIGLPGGCNVKLSGTPENMTLDLTPLLTMSETMVEKARKTFQVYERFQLTKVKDIPSMLSAQSTLAILLDRKIESGAIDRGLPVDKLCVGDLDLHKQRRRDLPSNCRIGLSEAISFAREDVVPPQEVNLKLLAAVLCFDQRCND